MVAALPGPHCGGAAAGAWAWGIMRALPFPLRPCMSVFLFKRLFTFLATLAVASVLVFAVLELLPGNVAQVMLGETATPESIAALEK